MKEYITLSIISLCLAGLAIIGTLDYTEYKLKEENKEYQFKILAKSENEYITIFEVDGQRFVYIYEGSLQKLD